MSLELKNVQTVAEQIAQDVGALLLDFFEQPHKIETKSSAFDIVTEADKAAESLILQRLRQHFPSHYVVSEEGGTSGAQADSAEYFWYVDPLDGTVNFANNIPIFSVSMALTGRDMQPLVGVVYDPAHKELFSAARGHGAAVNGRPLRVSTAASLEQAVLGTGFPYDKTSNPNNNLDAWALFSLKTRGLRRLGSAAIDICWVAAGRFDGYWEQRLNAWDCLAGLLCVLEAAGTCSDYDGLMSPKMYAGQQVVASNPHIHSQMLAVLAETTMR